MKPLRQLSSMLENKQGPSIPVSKRSSGNSYEKLPDIVDRKCVMVKLQCNECRRCGDEKAFSNPVFINCIAGVIEKEGKESLAGILIGDEARLSKQAIWKLSQVFDKSAFFCEFNSKSTAALKKVCPEGVH